MLSIVVSTCDTGKITMLMALNQQSSISFYLTVSNEEVRVLTLLHKRARWKKAGEDTG